MGLDFDDRVTHYLKILITLYADDTVIFAEIKINFKKHEIFLKNIVAFGNLTLIAQKQKL